MALKDSLSALGAEHSLQSLSTGALQAVEYVTAVHNYKTKEGEAGQRAVYRRFNWTRLLQAAYDYAAFASQGAPRGVSPRHPSAAYLNSLHQKRWLDRAIGDSPLKGALIGGRAIDDSRKWQPSMEQQIEELNGIVAKGREPYYTIVSPNGADSSAVGEFAARVVGFKLQEVESVQAEESGELATSTVCPVLVIGATAVEHAIAGIVPKDMYAHGLWLAD